eukprot:gene14789-20839_t
MEALGKFAAWVAAYAAWVPAPSGLPEQPSMTALAGRAQPHQATAQVTTSTYLHMLLKASKPCINLVTSLNHVRDSIRTCSGPTFQGAKDNSGNIPRVHLPASSPPPIVAGVPGPPGCEGALMSESWTPWSVDEQAAQAFKADQAARSAWNPSFTLTAQGPAPAVQPPAAAAQQPAPVVQPPAPAAQQPAPAAHEGQQQVGVPEEDEDEDFDFDALDENVAKYEKEKEASHKLQQRAGCELLSFCLAFSLVTSLNHVRDSIRTHSGPKFQGAKDNSSNIPRVHLPASAQAAQALKADQRPPPAAQRPAPAPQRPAPAPQLPPPIAQRPPPAPQRPPPAAQRPPPAAQRPAPAAQWPPPAPQRPPPAAQRPAPAPQRPPPAAQRPAPAPQRPPPAAQRPAPAPQRPPPAAQRPAPAPQRPPPAAQRPPPAPQRPPPAAQRPAPAPQRLPPAAQPPAPAQRPAPAAHEATAGEDDEDDGSNEIGDGDEDLAYTNVSTAKFEALGLRPHPDPVAQCSSLSCVDAPEADYICRLPAHVLKTGISALQFEAVRLACYKHKFFLQDGSRCGFFLGDRPGVGKGRQVAAMILGGFCHGRKKAVWFSASGDLAKDAERDMDDIGALAYKGVRIHELKNIKVKPGQQLADVPKMDSGVLFSTYSLLISGKSKLEGNTVEFGDGTRMQQIIDWLGPDFEGLIVLDEAHKAKNCIAKDELKKMGPGNAAPKSHSEDKRKESKTARAVVELQARLPLARILYVSATGATEAENLGYMTRLGLWGEGTVLKSLRHPSAPSDVPQSPQIPQISDPSDIPKISYIHPSGPSDIPQLPQTDQLEFVSMLKKRGVGAMELVAMELKMHGSYLARTLSYERVLFGQKLKMHSSYLARTLSNEGATFEQKVINVDDFVKETYNKAVDLWIDVRARTMKLAGTGQYTDDEGENKLAVVLGQYWGAHLRCFKQLCTASKVPAIAQMCLEELAAGNCVVIGLQSTGEARTTAYMNVNGGLDSTFDAHVEPISQSLINFVGKHIPPDESKALLQRIEDLNLPSAPLDDLIDLLGGPTRVAEMTGRKHRMIKQDDGTYKYVSRAKDEGISSDEVNIYEKDTFQADKKLIAIISQAASTGISLQADKSTLNTRLRVHITLELAWSADSTVQQLGAGKSRFASAVAKRLEQLGALTHGDRHASSVSDALSGFNIQGRYGSAALVKLWKYVQRTESCPINLTPQWMKDELNGALPDASTDPSQWQSARKQKMDAFFDGANNAMKLVDANKGGDVNRWLNRLLGMKVDMQKKIFGFFTSLLVSP